MKTIQINNYPEDDKVYLIRTFYEFSLKNDFKFHFLFQPICPIFSISESDYLNQVRDYLHIEEIEYLDYDHLFGPGIYIEEKSGIIDKYLDDIFVPMLHN